MTSFSRETDFCGIGYLLLKYFKLIGYLQFLIVYNNFVPMFSIQHQLF